VPAERAAPQNQRCSSAGLGRVIAILQETACEGDGVCYYAAFSVTEQMISGAHGLAIQLEGCAYVPKGCCPSSSFSQVPRDRSASTLVSQAREQPKSALCLESRGMSEARLSSCGGHDNHDYIGGFK